MEGGLTMPSVRSVREKDLGRIADALKAAAQALQSFASPAKTVQAKDHGGPVTAADRVIDELLFEMLPLGSEGWLSEERPDDAGRLSRARVWVVDPLDGSREFVASIPEYCISIALVEDGEAVAGGICNPATNELFLGSKETGVTLNGRAVQPRPCPEVKDALVLASRSEVNRGEWDHCRALPFTLQPMGSIAYKLARVAGGMADATWTLAPKHEWDVAAGVALVQAAGGVVRTVGGLPPHFNRPSPDFAGLAAFSAGAQGALEPFAEAFRG